MLGYGDSQMRGDESGEMGTQLQSIDVGTDFEIDDFRVHFTGVLVKSTSGQFKAWGTKSVSVLVSLIVSRLSKYV